MPTAETASARRAADLLPDVALLAVALAAGLGCARLTRGPASAHVLLPVAACVITGHVVVCIVRFLRAPDPVPSVIGVLSVALMAVWTLLPAATHAGLPTATTVRVLLQHFSDAGTVIRSHPTPVPATSGVVLCLAAGGGLAAVFARTLWSWQDAQPPGARRPLVVLLPTFGLFCYTALLSSDIDRVTGATVYLVAVLVFLAVADHPVADRPVADRRRSMWRSGTSAALAMGTVAVLVPLAASPGLAGLRLNAIPFSHGATNGAAGGSGSGGTGVAGVGALDLIDDMRAVLTTRSDIVMFTATSPIATYWQMAALSHFDGEEWLPDDATKSAAQGAPQLEPTTLPVLPGPPASHTFTVHVAIGDLRSTLLPVPPSTVAVSDAAVVQLEPGIGVLQPFATPADLTYDATARVPSAVDARPAPSVAALDASVPAVDLTPYLALPAVPTDVVRLAHQIVANAKGPAAKATALVRFFTAGKRFRYTLTPPSVAGIDGLSSFLFTTRAGFCQQFAGAYAVLARIDKLPTRLAVGFTTGTVETKNTYSVTGADAHSWPQVYLGPAAGWVSFEPTPASTDEPIGVGIRGGVPTTKPAHPAPVTSSTLAFPRPRRGAQVPTGAAGLGSNARPSPTTTTSSSSWGPVLLLALGATAVIIAAAVVGPWLWRRRRPRLRRQYSWHLRRARAPGAEIVARWEQAAAVLARGGLGRRASETLGEHAARLTAQAARPAPGVPSALLAPRRAPGGAGAHAGRALDAYRALAELAARASYAPDPCTEADVAEARRLSESLRGALRRGALVGGWVVTGP